MPLDILYEVRDISLIQYQVNQSWTGVASGTQIFGHLPPSGLLSLSRVSKAFRQLLMSRSSLFLWKTSYSLIPDVPTCPEDMSEPAWAHLLFGGAYCYVRWLSHVELFSFKFKVNDSDLWRKARSENLVFLSSSCLQVLHESPVSDQPLSNTIFQLRTFSLLCARSVPMEIRRAVPSDTG
jgi:hypothetical protein